MFLEVSGRITINRFYGLRVYGLRISMLYDFFCSKIKSILFVCFSVDLSIMVSIFMVHYVLCDLVDSCS